MADPREALDEARRLVEPDLSGLIGTDARRWAEVSREKAKIYALIDIAESLRIIAGKMVS